ncbi:MAG: hypothetical protein J5449_12250, partial [Oscillospiraceae bacterium]|nr:hypothetical protein [Oscillospiraceae bacterium]
RFNMFSFFWKSENGFFLLRQKEKTGVRNRTPVPAPGGARLKAAAPHKARLPRGTRSVRTWQKAPFFQIAQITLREL